MDTEKIKMLADKIRRNRTLFTDHDAHQDMVHYNLAPDIIDETYRGLSEGVREDDHSNIDLINTIITKASELNLNGRNASMLLTLIYLLKMDPKKFESQREIAINTGQAISTVERHIKFLRSNLLIETKVITDGYGSRTVYTFEGLKDTFRTIGLLT